ncbi:MAG: imidazoleglycerol-phosphate dehydratase HisB [Mogibacterium sp.]|nr:imidazoleglycerol-phosphate dehydratase HisB [Mogibacterium sp.]
MRNAEIIRKTAETDIELWLELDGGGKSEIDTGVGFLDHMLTLLARHGGFDLVVRCTGDTYVDDHQSVEDIGIALGRAFAEAVGDKRGICRYGDTTLPMDEALILTAVDISGRSCLEYALEIPTQKVGTFDTELVEEFLIGFVRTAGITLHVRQLAGKNSHHIIEGTFKSLARTLRKAVAYDERFRNEIPSTKGTLREEEHEIDLYAEQKEAAEDAPFPVSEPEPEEESAEEPAPPETAKTAAAPAAPRAALRFDPYEEDSEDWFDGVPGPDEDEYPEEPEVSAAEEPEPEPEPEAPEEPEQPEEEPEPAENGLNRELEYVPVEEPSYGLPDDGRSYGLPDDEDAESEDDFWENSPEHSRTYRRFETFDYSDYDGDSDSDADLESLVESMARASLNDGKTQVAMSWREESGTNQKAKRSTGLDGTLVHNLKGAVSKGLGDEDYAKGIVKEESSTKELEKELIEKGLL